MDFTAEIVYAFANTKLVEKIRDGLLDTLASTEARGFTSQRIVDRIAQLRSHGRPRFGVKLY